MTCTIFCLSFTDIIKSSGFFPFFWAFLKEHACLKCLFISLLVASLLSMLIPFAMIPVAFRIKDETANFTIPVGVSSDLVKLITTDGLWYWMVTASSDQLGPSEEIRVFLSERLETVWINSSGSVIVSNSQLSLTNRAFALPGTTFSIAHNMSTPNSSTSVGTQVIEVGQDTPLCQELVGASSNDAAFTCIINQTGFYSVVLVPSNGGNSTISYHFSIKILNESFYNSSLTSFLRCTLSQSMNECWFELDCLTEYHLFAFLNLNVTRTGNVTLDFKIEGRRTWYSLLIFLFTPLITLLVLLTVICLCACCTYH